MIGYFVITGLLDSLRARVLLCANVAVVVGICLPVLVQMWMEHGIISDLRDKIEQSPDALRLQVSTNREARAFSADAPALPPSFHHVQLVIPQVDNLQAGVRNPDTGRSTVPEGTRGAGVRLSSDQGLRRLIITRPGDPSLRNVGADVLGATERGIVLSRKLAEELGVRFENGEGGQRLRPAGAAQTVELLPIRSGDTTIGRHAVRVSVRGISPGEDSFVPLTLAVQLMAFAHGSAVAELGLPAGGSPPGMKFKGFVAFTPSAYKTEQQAELARVGLTSRLVGGPDHLPSDADRSLYTFGGFVRPDHGLFVYWLFASDGTPLGMTQNEVQNITRDKDDLVALPWTDPPAVEIVEERPTGPITRQARLIGMPNDAYLGLLGSFCVNPRARIRTPYVASEDRAVPWTLAWLSPRSVTTSPSPDGVKDADLVQGRLRLPGGQWLKVAYPPAPDDASVVVGPAALPGYVEGLAANRITFDAMANTFSYLPTSPLFLQADVYATTLDDLVPLNDALRQPNTGYAVTTDPDKAREMRGIADHLSLISKILLCTLMIFGVITTTFVFWEITLRKRGALGIMRAMGATRAGVVWFICARSVLISASAVVMTLTLGLAAAALLRPIARLEPDSSSVLWVALLATMCSVLGVAVPAFYTASRLDPIEAMTKAKMS